MATIKSFTDLQQSKKLAEFLPLESADMIYTMVNGYHTPFIRIETIKEMYEDDVLCWSLAALLSVLPQGEYKDADLCFGGYERDKYIPEWFCSYAQQEPFILEICHADNPVDACYKLILKLHELNLL